MNENLNEEAKRSKILLISQLFNPNNLFTSIDTTYKMDMSTTMTTTKRDTIDSKELIINTGFNVLSISMIVLIILAGLITTVVMFIFINKLKVYVKLYLKYKEQLEREANQQQNSNSSTNMATAITFNEIQTQETFVRHHQDELTSHNAVVNDFEEVNKTLLNHQISITNDLKITYNSSVDVI